MLPEYITINGTRYASSNLSEKSRNLAINIQVADDEISRAQRQLALLQTARNTYISALIESIKENTNAPSSPEKPKKPRAPRKTKAKPE